MGRHPWFWVPSAPQGGEGGDERWLITYADMITLLLVLFIILYSMANTDLEKFQALAESLREGFGATASGRAGAAGAQGGTHPVFDTEGGGTTPLELFPENQIPIEIFEFAQMLEGMGGQGSEGGLMDELQGIVEQAAEAAGREGIDVTGMGANIQIEYNERGIRIIIFPDQILFESGSARLRPGFREILDRLYDPLLRLRNRIEIQGHTDSAPINTATFPSNWELSAGRAGAVIRYFEQKGMPPARLQAAGYADTLPRAENTTREGRAKNRRVELLVLREENVSALDWAKQVSQLDSDTPIQDEPPAEATVGNEPQTSLLPGDEEIVDNHTGH
jgi:chemotaxis protein MotB